MNETLSWHVIFPQNFISTYMIVYQKSLRKFNFTPIKNGLLLMYRCIFFYKKTKKSFLFIKLKENNENIHIFEFNIYFKYITIFFNQPIPLGGGGSHLSLQFTPLFPFCFFPGFLAIFILLSLNSNNENFIKPKIRIFFDAFHNIPHLLEHFFGNFFNDGGWSVEP